MRLYFARGTSSLATRIVLLECGLPFEETEITKVMMREGGDFRTINPLGYVPALQLDDGSILTEGSAISQFLVDQVPEKALAPPNGTIARARMQAWLNFLAGELHKGSLTALFIPAMPEEAKALFRTRAGTRLAHLNAHLANHDYLLGKEYSIADAHCFVMLSWLHWVRIDIEEYPDLVRYHALVGARLAVNSALQAEHLVPWPNTVP